MKTSATGHRKLAAILFTHTASYSALARRDETVALELLEEHRQVQRGFAPAGPGNCSSRNQL
jgi:hypothetical protein